jgi:radical SAM superfamily enzyme YgiQ (UPF0313 family)
MANSQLYIKLISPKMSLRPMDSEFKRRMSPSLSLVTLANLTPKIHRVIIADENTGPIDYNDRPDIVGINVNVDTSEKAKNMAEIYRGKGTKVIFGGIHASASPLSLSGYCDSICIGAAEISWGYILEDFINGRLKKFYTNPISDLSKVPITDWSFIKAENYLYSNIIVTSRGCPHNCEFCYNSCSYVDNKYRNRPIQDVLEEIDRLTTKQAYFIDDNLIGNIDYCHKLVDELAKRDLIWHAAVSANIVHHKNLIDKMALAGCRSLFIGFETINQGALKEVNKKQNRIELYEELIDYLHNKAIMVNASLVFGFDSDKKDIFKQTLGWLIKNRVETVTSHILTPYPGTKLYKRLSQENRITDFELSNYNTSNVVFKPKNMTGKELRDGYLWFYKEFYKHKNIFKRIPKCRENYLPFLLFNYCYRKYGKSLARFLKNRFMQKAGKLSRFLSYGIG